MNWRPTRVANGCSRLGSCDELLVARAARGGGELVELERLADHRHRGEARARALQRVLRQVPHAVRGAAQLDQRDPPAREPAVDERRVGLGLELLALLQLGSGVVALPLRLAHVVAQRGAHVLLGAGDEALVADRDAEQQPDREREEDGDERQGVVAEVEHRGSVSGGAARA